MVFPSSPNFSVLTQSPKPLKPRSPTRAEAIAKATATLLTKNQGSALVPWDDYSSGFCFVFQVPCPGHLSRSPTPTSSENPEESFPVESPTNPAESSSSAPPEKFHKESGALTPMPPKNPAENLADENGFLWSAHPQKSAESMPGFSLKCRQHPTENPTEHACSTRPRTLSNPKP